MDAEALKLTDAEIYDLLHVEHEFIDGLCMKHVPTRERKPCTAAETLTDAATAKAGWALYERLEVSDRELKGDVIGPLWAAGYWAGWDSARNALEQFLVAHGIPRPEEVAHGKTG